MSAPNRDRIVNRKFELIVYREQEALFAELRHREGTWCSPRVPLLIFEVCDRMQERVDQIQEYTVIQVEHTEQSLHVSVRDKFRGITIGVWLALTDNGELSVLVPPAEVEEAKDELYKVYAVRPLPGLMAVSGDGQLLLPVNTGVLCSPCGKPRIRDRFLIYGEQERWELVPTLPVCGVKSPHGGLTAVAVQGACDMYCEANTDGQGGGTVELYPMFRRHWIDPVDWNQREIRIAPLAPRDDLVVVTAKRLRRHVMEDLGKKTLRQRAAESPQCAYQQTAYTMKVFHGIQRQGIMMYGDTCRNDELLFKRTLTFADASRNLQRLKAAGLDRVYVQSVGWNPRGHDGAWPTDFPIEQRCGGEAGFREMIAVAKGLGYHITTHLNCASSFFKSPDFNPDRVVHDLWGQPKVVGFWGGGIKSTHWGLSFPDGWLEQRMNRMKSFGFNGMQYLDGMGNPLYLNYHPVHRGPRCDHAAGINRYLDVARSIFGGVETEMGYLYCVLHADAMGTGGSEWHLSLCKPEWPITGLLDQRVPVWQLALHDLITHENTHLTWQETLRCALFAEIPRDEWSAEPGVMALLDDARIAKLKARYDLCLGRLGRLVTEELTDWRLLADGVQQTRYADGTAVTADFNHQELLVNGKRVARPRAFSKRG